MAPRPQEKLNFEQNVKLCFAPKARVDFCNPQMGLNGQDVYTMYAFTDQKDQCVIGLSEGGLFKVYNDHGIEIVAGQKSQSAGLDINIVSKSGDISLTAEKNGSIRIRGNNIVVDADKDLTFVAGRDMTMKAKGRFLIQANQADCDALMGNLPPSGSSFLDVCFAGTYVGADVLGPLSGGLAVGVSYDNAQSNESDEDLFSEENTRLTGNETSGSFASGGAASGGALAE